MARPRNISRTVEKKVSIPENVVAQVELELYSEVEGRVPYGAWGSLLTGLLSEWLKKLEKARKLNETE